MEWFDNIHKQSAGDYKNSTSPKKGNSRTSAKVINAINNIRSYSIDGAESLYDNMGSYAIAGSVGGVILTIIFKKNILVGLLIGGACGSATAYIINKVKENKNYKEE